MCFKPVKVDPFNMFSKFTFISAVKGLIASKISFCSHNMCVYCLYLLCICKYTCMYILKI